MTTPLYSYPSLSTSRTHGELESQDMVVRCGRRAGSMHAFILVAGMCVDHPSPTVLFSLFVKLHTAFPMSAAFPMSSFPLPARMRPCAPPVSPYTAANMNSLPVPTRVWQGVNPKGAICEHPILVNRCIPSRVQGTPRRTVRVCMVGLRFWHA